MLDSGRTVPREAPGAKRHEIKVKLTERFFWAEI